MLPPPPRLLRPLPPPPSVPSTSCHDDACDGVVDNDLIAAAAAAIADDGTLVAGARRAPRSVRSERSDARAGVIVMVTVKARGGRRQRRCWMGEKVESAFVRNGGAPRVCEETLGKDKFETPMTCRFAKSLGRLGTTTPRTHHCRLIVFRSAFSSAGMADARDVNVEVSADAAAGDGHERQAVDDGAEEKFTATEERPQWGSTTEFILAAVGSAVGLGNLLRFPYMVFSHGGAAFLLPYALAVLLLGGAVHVERS